MFTFADGSNDDVRADYGKHNVKVLAASDEGDVDFLVYGYMNRGTYEGQMGVVFYHYDAVSYTHLSLAESRWFWTVPRLISAFSSMIW